MKIKTGTFTLSELDLNRPDLFFNLLQENRNRLADFFAGTLRKTETLAKTEVYCRQIETLRKEMNYLPFIISDSTTDAYIGLVDVKNIDMGIPKAELGYFIDRNYEGRGIITQAVGSIIEHLIEEYQFTKLLCRVGTQNTGSKRVALNNGFELEGIIKRDYKTRQGEVVDLAYYGRVFG